MFPGLAFSSIGLLLLVPPGTQTGEADAATRFYAEYPKAVERLEAATKNMHLTAELRQRKSGRDAPWIKLSILSSSDALRTDIHDETGRGRDRSCIERPGFCALVRDPFTDHAWAEDVGSVPNWSVKIFSSIHARRFLKATYCCEDGIPILGKIRNGEWSVKRISFQSGHPDRVVLDYSYVFSEPEFNYSHSGEGFVVFSPGDDWALCEHEYWGGAPLNQKESFRIDDFQKNPDGEPLAKDVEMVVSPLPASPVETQKTGAASWREYNEYKLRDASFGPIRDSEFTLQAVGVGARAGASEGAKKALVCLALAVCATALAAVWFTRRRLKQGAARA